MRTTKLIALAATVLLALLAPGLSPAANAAEGDNVSHVYGYAWDENGSYLIDGKAELFDVDPTVDPTAIPVQTNELGQNDAQYDFANFPEGDYWIRITGVGARQVNFYYLRNADSWLGYTYASAIRTPATGHVTSVGGGDATNAEVTAYRRGEGSTLYYVRQVRTDDDGNFQVDLPTDASYVINVRDRRSTGPAVWYGGPQLAAADVVTVDDETPITLGDTRLVAGRTVTGKVTNAKGTALADIKVLAGVDNGSGTPDYYSYAFGETNAAGVYTLKNVLPGDYKVSFGDSIDEYDSQFYKNAPIDQPENATVVPVTATSGTQTLSTVKLTATPGVADPAHNLVGTVKGANGKGASQINVIAIGERGWEYNPARTKRDGAYGLTMEPGSYQLYYSDSRNRCGPSFLCSLNNSYDDGARYQSKYYYDAYVPELAKSLVVADGKKTTARTVTLKGLGTLSGTVDVPAAKSGDYEDIYAVLMGPEGYVDDAWVNEDLTYEFDSVPAGRYTVLFEGERELNEGGDQRYVPQWYKDRYTARSAQQIALADGQDRALVKVVKLSFTIEALTQPTISGTAAKGKTLTAKKGTWSRTSQVAYAYQWYRGSSASASKATAIAGADDVSYKVKSADAGKYVFVQVKAYSIERAYEQYQSGTRFSSAKKVRK